jgi:hypothetical protein
MNRRLIRRNVINAIKNHCDDTLIDLLQPFGNNEIGDLDYIIGYSLKYKNTQSFKCFINRIDYIPYFLIRRLLRKKHNIEFTEIILDRLEMLENLESIKSDKIYAQILASLLKFHTNIEHLVQRILNSDMFNFEKIIKVDKVRINFIRICLNNTFRVQNLKAVIQLLNPYYIQNNIPLEELLYVILNRYRHLKKTFVLKQLSGFKGLLDPNYKINLESKDFKYSFSYEEEEEYKEYEEEYEEYEEYEEEDEYKEYEEEDEYKEYEEEEEYEEEYEEYEEYEEAYDMTLSNISNIKLGSLLTYFYMDTKYFIRDKIEFIEDIEDMDKIKAFKAYNKIKDIK